MIRNLDGDEDNLAVIKRDTAALYLAFAKSQP